MRVCKKWYSLATPYLYESIVIGKWKTLKTLSGALQRSRDSKSMDALGWWAKRLDVAMRDNNKDEEIALQYLTQIVQSLPNLTILVFRVAKSDYHCDFLPDSFLHCLSASAGSNLQALVWYTTVLTPFDYWNTFLASLPAIRTLSCIDMNLSPNGSTLTLPTLRTFYMPRCLQHTISLPSLRHLIFGVYSNMDVDMGWKTFLIIHGHQLDVIQINVIQVSGLLLVLDAISQYCPNLHRLDIAIQTWWELNTLQGLALPTTINTIGLYCFQRQASRSCFKQLFDTLRKVRFGPAFKTIRLLHPATATNLSRHHQPLLWVNTPRLSQLGFEVLDYEGKPLL